MTFPPIVLIEPVDPKTKKTAPKVEAVPVKPHFSKFLMPAANDHGIELDEHGFPKPESLQAWHAKNNPSR